MAVEKSSYTVVAPKGYNLRYKSLNDVDEPTRTYNDLNDLYTWELSNLKPIKGEYASNAVAELAPRVLIGLSSFSMEGYAGEMGSWESYGEWIAKQ